MAVKDVIDLAGFPTTAACPAVAKSAAEKARDAHCVSLLKEAGYCVVGKTNLHELAFGPSGVNHWFGTPTNPLDASAIPGGSSSGSAVAVALEEADLGLGTDTGGSVRIPAACCGIVGLKPGTGRIPTSGLFPLAPTLDTVGLLGRTVDDVAAGWSAFHPFSGDTEEPATAVGRLITRSDPAIEDAVSRALHLAEYVGRPVHPPLWRAGYYAALLMTLAEAGELHGHYLSDREGLGDDVATSLATGRRLSVRHITWAYQVGANLKSAMREVFRAVEVIVLPTLPCLPPRPEAATRQLLTGFTRQVNLAGLPAIALPVPIKTGRLPASVQIIGPPGSESKLLATAARLEAAVAGEGGRWEGNL